MLNECARLVWTPVPARSRACYEAWVGSVRFFHAGLLCALLSGCSGESAVAPEQASSDSGVADVGSDVFDASPDRADGETLLDAASESSTMPDAEMLDAADDPSEDALDGADDPSEDAIDAADDGQDALDGAVEGQQDVAPVLVGVVVSPPYVSIHLGTKEQLEATAEYSDGSSLVVTDVSSWTSSNPGTANVSDAPGSKGLVTPVGPGTATIRAEFEGFVGGAFVDVHGGIPVHILLEPDTATVSVGLTQAFHATCVWNDNSTSDVTDLATWSASDDAIATVDAHGLASGVVPGLVTITAVFGMVPGNAELAVVP